uniref:Uncharacterized protein n=1 Tax=Arundo donax TaxID=35708 RepID=A0A0A9HJQ7_ARUDO
MPKMISKRVDQSRFKLLSPKSARSILRFSRYS